MQSQNGRKLWIENVSQEIWEYGCLPADLPRRPVVPYMQLLPSLREVLAPERKVLGPVGLARSGQQAHSSVFTLRENVRSFLSGFKEFFAYFCPWSFFIPSLFFFSLSSLLHSFPIFLLSFKPSSLALDKDCSVWLLLQRNQERSQRCCSCFARL